MQKEIEEMKSVMARRGWISDNQVNWEVVRDQITHGPVGLHLVIGHVPGFCRP